MMTSAGCAGASDAISGGVDNRIKNMDASRNAMQRRDWGRRIVTILWRSECRRSVDPQQPGLAAAGIFPVMRRGAFKIKAVAALQMVLLAVKGDLQFSAEHEEELLAFVGVGLAAAGLGGDAEQMRLH